MFQLIWRHIQYWIMARRIKKIELWWSLMIPIPTQYISAGRPFNNNKTTIQWFILFYYQWWWQHFLLRWKHWIVTSFKNPLPHGESYSINVRSETKPPVCIDSLGLISSRTVHHDTDTRLYHKDKTLPSDLLISRKRDLTHLVHHRKQYQTILCFLVKG